MSGCDKYDSGLDVIQFMPMSWVTGLVDRGDDYYDMARTDWHKLHKLFLS